MSTFISITLPLSVAIDAALAVKAHMGVDGNTPILSSARLSVNEDGATLVSTDRYTIASYNLAESDVEDGDLPNSLSVTLPATLIAWLAALKPTALECNHRYVPYVVRIDVEDGEDQEERAIMAHVKPRNEDRVEISTSHRSVTGNYPPVDRLLPAKGEGLSALPDVMLLNPKHLERVTSYAKRDKDRKVQFGASSTGGIIYALAGPVTFAITALKK